MAQASKSQILNKMKTGLKGAWKEARKVIPKARGGGGLPPNLKNAVFCCKTYKMDLASNGNPYFMLGGIIKEPEDLVGRTVTFMWFIADSDYSTAGEEATKLANDLGLLCPEQEIPEEEEGILDMLKDLCDRGVHGLFNTGRERKGGKAPNSYIQGLAEGWEDTPEDGAGEMEAGSARDRASSNQNGKPAASTSPTSTQAQNRQAKKQQAPEPEPEPPVDENDEGEDYVEDDSQEEGEYIPQIGDVYEFKAPKTKEKEDYKVTAVDEEKQTVQLTQCKVPRGKKANVVNKVPFSKLGED